MSSINIAEKISCSRIHGPGSRFVIWVQGCSIHCEGCSNKELWPFFGGKSYKVDDLIQEIKKLDKMDGITITGGEPLDQAEAILQLILKLKKENITSVVFTGYDETKIQSNPVRRDIFQLADILIIGPFQEKLKNPFLRWRGSSNQTIIFNNPTYKQKYANISEINECEIHIDESGKLILTGFPDEKIKELFKQC